MKEDKVDWQQLGISTDDELKLRDNQMNKTEEEGLKNTLKYFDRIHDKVFKFNNILIGGYFFLIKFENSCPYYLLLLPFVNLVIIIYLEYRMMEKSRFEAQVKSMSMSKIKKHGKAINRTNQYSLLILLTTTIITIIFLTQVYLSYNHNPSSKVPPSSASKELNENVKMIQGDTLNLDPVKNERDSISSKESLGTIREKIEEEVHIIE